MRFHDNGSWFSVYVSVRDVQAFKASYPCSNIPADTEFCFQFEKNNGDLVDIRTRTDGRVIDRDLYT